MKEIFYEGKSVDGKHVGIFHMILPHTKLIFPCILGGFKQVQYKKYI